MRRIYGKKLINLYDQEATGVNQRETYDRFHFFPRAFF